MIAFAVAKALMTFVGVFGVAFALQVVQPQEFLFRILFLIAVFVVAIALFVMIAVFASGAAAICVGVFGEWGKNRNPLLAALTTAAAVAGGSTLMFFVTIMYSDADQMILFIETVAGGAIGMAFGSVLAFVTVRDWKYCERCDTPMRQARLKSVSLGGMVAMARSLPEGDLVHARMNAEAAPEAPEGSIDLHTCAQCGEGYLEVTGTFAFTWVAGNKAKSTTKSWLVGSVRLQPDEAAHFAQLRPPAAAVRMPSESK